MDTKLYIVSTPIGNLSDITLRAIDVLKQVSFIVCEDTRRTLKLLNKYGIKKPLVSFYAPIEEKKVEFVLRKLKAEGSCALVADAGTPIISDPGFILVERCIKENIKVIPVPGPSSVLASLVASGIRPSPFVFLGFLPKGNEKKKIIRRFASFGETMVFFESPKRIYETMCVLKEVLGSDRRACIAREITKLHEEFIRGTLEELCEEVSRRNLLGEITVVVEGSSDSKVWDDRFIKEKIKLLKEMGYERRQIVEIVSILLEVKKNKVKRLLDGEINL